MQDYLQYSKKNCIYDQLELTIEKVEMKNRKSEILTFEKLMLDIDAKIVNMGQSDRRIAEFLRQSHDQAALLSTAEVALTCQVHSSSVVRFAQTLGLSGYKQLQGILKSQHKLNLENFGSQYLSVKNKCDTETLNVFILADSGKSFNQDLEMAAEKLSDENYDVQISGEYLVSNEIEPDLFAKKIEDAAGNYDAIFLVAREHPLINDAVRSAVKKGTYVICITTDLPASGRTSYVGSDQYSSGSSAAWLVGKMVHNNTSSRVLFVYSVPFRCQQDREQGFRHILRSEFPHLILDERVSSNEDSLITHKSVSYYIEKNGPPAAIYNVSGANIGIGKALDEHGVAAEVVFIGHELNDNSKKLLRSGLMDVAIGHNMDTEITLAVSAVRQAINKAPPKNTIVESQIFTRYNIPEFL